MPAFNAPLDGSQRQRSNLTNALTGAIQRANKQIFDIAVSQPHCRGMGTTLVTALFQDNRITIGHVGDSRLYRLRDDHLERLTADHSLVQELVDKGYCTPERARELVPKNIVTRAMGIEESVTPDFQEQHAEPKDIYLLCSDGLSDLVEDGEIYATLADYREDLQAAAKTLVDQANDNGGKDNISIILVQVLKPFPEVGNDSCPRTLEETLQIVSLTDVGRKRRHNEDSVASDPRMGAAVLADGMGGANAGEVASAMAVNVIMQDLRIKLMGEEPASQSDACHRGPSDAQKPGVDWPQAAEVVAEAEAGRVSIIQKTTLEGLNTVEPLNDIEDKHMENVRRMEIGDWVEFRRKDESNIRARLTWINQATGAYLFTNRKGLKVAETTSHGLAIEFGRSSAEVIDNVPLFDRVISSLMERLKGVDRLG